MRKIDAVTLSKIATEKSVELRGLDSHKTTLNNYTEEEAFSILEPIVGENVCIVNVENDYVIQCTVFIKDHPFI